MGGMYDGMDMMLRQMLISTIMGLPTEEVEDCFSAAYNDA